LCRQAFGLWEGHRKMAALIAMQDNACA